MVSHSILRKKFPSKRGSGQADRRKDIASVKKAIALEYRRKRAELGFSLPTARRGLPYYMVILIGLCLLGGLVGSAIFKRRGLDLTGSNHAAAVKSLNTVAIALGRYRYHVGTYPTTEEGLEQLALTRVRKPGWMGPYINEVLPDPWGNAYVYENRGDGTDPVLFSKGPDAESGTADDVMADRSFLKEAFRDVSWADGWVPWHLRGIMWVENEREKEIAERRVDIALGRNSKTEGATPLNDSWLFCAATQTVKGVKVRLPLDWRAPASEVCSSAVTAVFRRSFFVGKKVEGHYVALRIAAVSGKFSVRLNGKELAVEDVGRDGYEVDMTKTIRYGSDNDLEITVDAGEAEAKSAGITGDVWVDVADPKERVVCGSMKVRFDKVSKDEAVMIVERRVSSIDGTNVTKYIGDRYDIVKPKIWTLDNPVVRNGNLTGRYVIRTVEPSTAFSIVLNGGETPVKGVITDSSLGILGEAFSAGQARIKLTAFKEAGVNVVVFGALKTNRAFFDLCDEIGLLAFDMDDVERLKIDRSRFIRVGGMPDEEDSAYLKSLFMPDAKTLFIGPHWTWKPGEKVRIECVTDADGVEFFVNGISVGHAERISECRFAKDVAYEPGELKAIARKNGVYYSERILKTAYRPEVLRFVNPSSVLKADECLSIEVALTDEYGQTVPDGTGDVEFSVEDGPGEFIAFCGTKREESGKRTGVGRKAVAKISNGRAAVVVRRNEGSNIPLRIKAKSPGMRTAVILLPCQ